MASITYGVTIRWTGDRGTGTSAYTAYARDHAIEGDGRPAIAASSDPAFRGTPGCWTPEELFVAALSSCHQLWYLHLCAEAGIVVRAYEDRAAGTMVTGPDGGGRFVSVTLRPEVRIERGPVDRAIALHDAAHARCFIANSTNVPIAIEATVR